MSLGQTIRRQRKELGLTQEQVATKARISKPYLSNIETDKVKNPPTDEVLRRVERALSFRPKELIGIAHLVVTPMDVREKHEMLQAENQRLRAVLKRVLDKEPQAAEQLDTEALEGHVEKVPNVRTLSAGVVVPVINKISAGYPEYFGDLDYPVSIADEYVRCPDVHDPQAFAARVVGDSMAPKYTEGDIVIFAPNTPAADGDDCFVRFADDWSTTFKQYRAGEGGKIRLVARNEKYPPETYEPERISGLWPAVMRVQRLG